MQVALDEGPGPPIKQQGPELGKLHEVVSILVRCVDVSTMCHSSNEIMLPNPYADQQMDTLYTLSKEVSELLFSRTSYVKKLIEDTNVGEDGLKLLQYCSWENPHFSRCVLSELLGQCAFAYWHDMRHHTDLLLNILLMEDSWQSHRIHNALMGVSDEREGLLETIQRSKAHYQKRAYQIIKCLVQLFKESQVANTMLISNRAIARLWSMAVEWLQDELERQRVTRSQYNYSSWSPPAPSNENTNGYILERSQSAQATLQMACELCPEEVRTYFFDIIFIYFYFFAFPFKEQDESFSDVEQIEETITDEQPARKFVTCEGDLGEELGIEDDRTTQSYVDVSGVGGETTRTGDERVQQPFMEMPDVGFEMSDVRNPNLTFKNGKVKSCRDFIRSKRKQRDATRELEQRSSSPTSTSPQTNCTDTTDPISQQLQQQLQQSKDMGTIKSENNSQNSSPSHTNCSSDTSVTSMANQTITVSPNPVRYIFGRKCGCLCHYT